MLSSTEWSFHNHIRWNTLKSSHAPPIAYFHLLIPPSFTNPQWLSQTRAHRLPLRPRELPETSINFHTVYCNVQSFSPISIYLPLLKLLRTPLHGFPSTSVDFHKSFHISKSTDFHLLQYLLLRVIYTHLLRKVVTGWGQGDRWAFGDSCGGLISYLPLVSGSRVPHGIRPGWNYARLVASMWKLLLLPES